MKDTKYRFKVGDHVLINDSLFSHGVIVKIVHSKISNRWLYKIKVDGFFIIPIYRKYISLDQEKHNEQKIKKLLGVD